MNFLNKRSKGLTMHFIFTAFFYHIYQGCRYFWPWLYIYIWPELLTPLVNMNKEACVCMVNHFDLLFKEITKNTLPLKPIEKAISNTRWPQLLTLFYSILFWNLHLPRKQLWYSPIMPDEFREHLTRDQRPYFYTEFSQIFQIPKSMFMHSHL